MHFVISNMPFMPGAPQSNTTSDLQVNKVGRESTMFAITGVTGKVGGAVARGLLAQGHQVRAVVRDAGKGRFWSAQGCEIAIASVEDATGLTKAFHGVEGVFLMTPPNYDPEPGFPETHKAAAAIRQAIETSRPGKVVFLSTVGAHVAEHNLLNNSKITEDMLRTTSIPIALLRAAWFMENAAWDVEAAQKGLIPSFLQPLDHRIPMVAAGDIARTAAELLGEAWTGVRIIELEGPRRYSANDIAAGFATALQRPVRAEAVPHDQWETLFRSQGMKHPTPRIRMIDGFNEGWIDFESGKANSVKERTTLESVLRSLVMSNSNS
jgi:NAD(P)H dehydrogenase (quinone)